MSTPFPTQSHTTFDQSGQTIQGDQTNIAGDQFNFNYGVESRPSILDEPSPDLFWLTAGRSEELAQFDDWYNAVLIDKAGQKPRTVVLTGAKEIGKREIVQRWIQTLQNREEPPLLAQSSYPPAYFDQARQETFYATARHGQKAWTTYSGQLRLRYPHAELLGGRGWLALAAQLVQQSTCARATLHAATPPAAEPESATVRRQMNELVASALDDAPLVLVLEHVVETDPTLQLLLESWNRAFFNTRFLLVLVVDHPYPLHHRNDPNQETEWLQWLRKQTAPHASRSYPALHVGPLRRHAVAALLTPACASYADKLHELTVGIPDLLRELLRHWEREQLAQRVPDGRWRLAITELETYPGTLYEQYIEAPLQACAARAQELGFDVDGALLLTWVNYAVWEGDTFTDEALAHAVGQQGDALEDFQELLDEVLCKGEADDETDSEADDQIDNAPERPGALLVELDDPVVLPTADLERQERYMARYRFDPPLLARLILAQQSESERIHYGTGYLQALIAAYRPMERVIAPLLIQLAQQLGRDSDAQRFQQWIIPADDRARAELLLATLRVIAVDTAGKQHFVRRTIDFFKTFYGKAHPHTFIPLLDEAKSYANDLSQTGNQAKLLTNMGLVYAALGETQQALALYQEALPLRRKAHDIRGEAATLSNMGLVYADLGETQQALALYQEALPLERKVGDVSGEAYTLSNMGDIYADLGEPQKALALYQEALPLRRKVGDISGEAYTLTSMGSVYLTQGEPQQALALYQEALPLRRKVGDIGGEASTLSNMGTAYADLGEPQQALALYQEALPLERKVGDIRGEAATFSNMGSVYSDLGETQQALALYKEALPLRRKVGDISGEAYTLTSMGDLHRAEGALALAAACWERALVLFEQVGSPNAAAVREKLAGLRDDGDAQNGD